MGAWLSDPARTAGCRELSGVGTLRVPESSACAGAGLLDACCATGPSACGEPMALYPRVTSLRDPFAVAGVAVALPSRTGGPPARDHAATAEADTWTRFPRSVPRSAPGHRVRRLGGSQLSFLAGAAVDSAGFGPVRESRSSKSDRVRPVHRFNFPRLAAVLVIAVVGFVACAQGPGTPELREPDEPSGPAGPPDTAPAFAVTVADQTYTEGAPISALTLPEASGGDGPLSYSLASTVPGLTFAAATRTLSGTPTTAGSYNVEYKVEDGDANTAASDAATLTFTVTVEEAPALDTAPGFGLQTVPDQSYTVGVAIGALVLPQSQRRQRISELFSAALDSGAVVLPEQPHADRHTDHRRHLRHDLPSAGWRRQHRCP